MEEIGACCGPTRTGCTRSTVPGSGPIADRFAAVTCVMTGGRATPVNPLTAFDAVVYTDTITPWHHG